MAYTLINADMREALCNAPGASIDAVVTDPPHGLAMGAWDDHIAHDPDVWRLVLNVLKPGHWLVAKGAARTFHRLACAIEDAGFVIDDMVVRLTGGNMPKSKRRLKNAIEPCVLAYRPGPVVPFNIDGCRVPAPDPEDYAEKCASVVGCKSSRTLNTYGDFSSPRRDSTSELGRWPANAILDDDTARELDSSSRFFYCARASAAERAGTDHPTVTPIALARYLIKLVCPPGGKVLDPFAGTGSIGVGALLEGRSFHGIERDPGYAAQADVRLRNAML